MTKKRMRQLVLAVMLVLAMTITSTTEGKADTKEIEVVDLYRIEWISDGMAIILKGRFPDRQCGLIDKNGNEIIMGKYDLIWDFSDGIAKARKDGKYGYVNKKGEEVVKCQYDAAWKCSDGLAKVRIGNGIYDHKYGYVNKMGIEVIQCQYEMLCSYSDGMAMGKKGGKNYILSW